GPRPIGAPPMSSGASRRGALWRPPRSRRAAGARAAPAQARARGPIDPARAQFGR
ncbi:hypothetical protein MNEG_14683, partial [Monoraphidium neglectum]